MWFWSFLWCLDADSASRCFLAECPLNAQCCTSAGASNPPNPESKNPMRRAPRDCEGSGMQGRIDHLPSLAMAPPGWGGEWQNLVVSCDIPEIVPHCPLQPRLTLPLHVQSWREIDPKDFRCTIWRTWWHGAKFVSDTPRHPPTAWHKSSTNVLMNCRPRFKGGRIGSKGQFWNLDVLQC